MHFPLAVSLRHFLVENPPAGRHPLHVAGAELAPVPQTVAVIDASRQYIRNRLDAAVGMPGKSGAIVFRTIVAEVVEQEEWIELAGIPEAEGATQLHARTFNRGFGLDDALHGPNGHGGLTSCSMFVVLTAQSPIAPLGDSLSGKGPGYRRRELIDESSEKSSRRLIGDCPV